MTPPLFSLVVFPCYYAVVGVLVIATLIAREPGLWWASVRGLQRSHPEFSAALLHVLYFANAAAVWPYVLWIHFREA